jgi:hypothetical protein
MRWLINLLPLMLVGCAATPVIEQPPASLLGPCTVASRALVTNIDLFIYTLELRTALRDCDDDKTALRTWAKELK